jgi:5S rRNA maturation endonuclease (ribonuclease M5)
MTHSESLSDLVGRVDLVALVSTYAGSGRTTGSRTTFHCPHPGHIDRHPSFVVSVTRNGRQVWRCFSQCDRHGDALELVKWLDSLDTATAAARLRSFLGDATAATQRPTRRMSVRPVPSADLSQQCSPIDNERASWLLEKYAGSRGWDMQTVERFGLTVVRDARGCERIRHPFYAKNAEGEWVCAYWQDRGTRDVLPKWLSPRGVSPVLFNLRSLESDTVRAVVICEGAPDTITAASALSDAESIACVGVPGVSAWRPEWAPMFQSLRIVVAADPDDAGHRLEDAVRKTIPKPITLIRPNHGDLTETAKAVGISELRELLLTACATTQPQHDPEGIELLRAYFPGARLISESNKHE